MNEKNRESMASIQRRNRKRNSIPALAMAGPVSFWMIFFVVLPLIYVVAISFMSRNSYGGIEYTFTINNYKELLDPLYLKIIWKSGVLSFKTTVLCLLIGYPLAYYIAKQPSKKAAKLIILIMIPFWTSSLVRLYSWLLMFQPNSFFNHFLMRIGLISEPIDILYTNGLILIGMFSAMLPFAVLPLYSSIEKLDKSLLEASKDLGAKPVTTFWRVTIPMTGPGIFSSVILVFIPSLGLYTVPEVLGGGKIMLIGNLIRNQFIQTKNWPFGASIAILLIIITLFMLFLYTRIASLDDMEVF